MIKHINQQNFLTTPFIAAKSWNLYNVQNEAEIVIEQPILESANNNLPVALDYVDYASGDQHINYSCNIAIEQQADNIAMYSEGIHNNGTFDPNTSPKNSDGTYKYLIHSQIKNAFYNSYRNPLEIFGIEHIDFPLSKTIRNLAEFFRVFTIPRKIFGEKIIPGTVKFYDATLDDTVDIFDDGYQNLIAGYNIFSNVQELRGQNRAESFVNEILEGTASYICRTYNNIQHTASNSDTGSHNISFLYGYVFDKGYYIPFSDTGSMNITFENGSIYTANFNLNFSDTGSHNVSFLNGSVYTADYNLNFSDTGSIDIAFLHGAITVDISAKIGLDIAYVHISAPIVVFNNLSTGADTYLWYFGDGTTSTEQNPTHTYASEGYYKVILEATNTLTTQTATTTAIVMVYSSWINCGDVATYLGGSEFPSVYNVNISNNTGVSSFDYNIGNSPCKFIVVYNGIEVINTGYVGNVEWQSALDAALIARGLPTETLDGSGIGTVSFIKSIPNSIATVVVYSPLIGTSWQYTLHCPT